MLSVLRRLKTPKLTQAEKETQSNYAWIRYMSRAPFSLCNSQRFLSEALLLSFSLTSSTSGHVHAGRENGLVTGLKWHTILSWVHPISTKSYRRNGLGEKNLEKTGGFFLFFFFNLCHVALEPPDGDVTDQHLESPGAVEVWERERCSNKENPGVCQYLDL